MRIFAVGQFLFAIAAASLAVWSLVYGDFAWGAQSLLDKIPWRETWVYGSALIVLAASAGVCFPRTAVPSVLTIGAYQAVGAAIAIPQILAEPLSIGAWYPFCEALTVLVGAWILYAILQHRSRRSGIGIASDRAVRAAQVLFGLTCVFYGVSHFAYADYTAQMVPGWLPGRLALAYITGVGHVAAGLAIVLGILPRLGATLEAIMMSLFGLTVWLPSFFAQPRPKWAVPPEHQWSEFLLTLMLAASAWIVAISFGDRGWSFASRPRVSRARS
jgi:uncharacterized membrane protein